MTLEAQLGLIGGTMGLLTGFSILSGVEIIFYILKLVFFLRNNIDILFSGSWCHSTSLKKCKCVLTIGCANVARGRIETQTIFCVLTYFLIILKQPKLFEKCTSVFFQMWYFYVLSLFWHQFCCSCTCSSCVLTFSLLKVRCRIWWWWCHNCQFTCPWWKSNEILVRGLEKE